MKNRLIERINDNLKKNRIASEIGRFSDNSGSWIEIRKGDVTLTISFDSKGDNIKSINAFKDVLQVVDQEKIF